MAPGVAEREVDRSARRMARAVVLGLVVGAGTGVAAVALAFAIVAVPIYFVGSDEGGLDAGLVRLGLFAVAVPAGVAVGTVAGFVVARWYARGAPLPEVAGR
jgi:hypothetical protein